MLKSFVLGAKRLKGTILIIAWCMLIGVVIFVVGHRIFIGVTPNWVFIPTGIGGLVIVLLSFGASSKTDDSREQ
jgi:hypothetical protein